MRYKFKWELIRLNDHRSRRSTWFLLAIGYFDTFGTDYVKNSSKLEVFELLWPGLLDL